MFLRALLVALISLACATAQDFRATLSGSVTDPSGAMIPSAIVKVTNTTTAEIKTVQSDGEGHYTVPYLMPGTYNVEATAAGFQKLQRDGIVLHVSDKVDLALQLTVGAATESVMVQGQQEILDTADASRGVIFDQTKVQELPLNGRQEYMLMALSPGVLFSQEQFGSSGYSGTRGWDVSSSYKINGARPGTNVFLLNGVRISDNGGTWDVAPNIEAVQEFKVMINTYDAQFGGFSGGAVNTTVKSGSNQFHGDVYEYFRNSAFDANNFANNYNGQPTPFHNQNQFGGVFGGPIRKNKDYFFGSFEGWREVLPAPVTITVPTDAEKQGNFGANGFIVYDPLTSAACNASTNCTGHSYVRTPFPNNVVPQSRISPVSQKILAFFPEPTNSGLQNNYNAPNVKDQYMYNQPIIRYDHNFSDSDRLYAMFTWQHGTENRVSNGIPGPAGDGNINNARTDQNYVLDYTRVLSPTSVFDVSLSYGRFTQNAPGWGDPSYQASTLGIAGNCAPTIATCAAPQVNFGNSISTIFGNGNFITNWYSFNTYDLKPSFTLTRGKHSLHIGGEVVYQARPSQSSGYASGTFTFGTGWTQHYSDQNLGTTDGNSIATLLLGNATSGYTDFNPSIYITRPFFAIYAQDDWKVSSKLTVNLGLRQEVQIPWMERYNRAIRGIDFNSVNPDSAAVLAAWQQDSASWTAANPGLAAQYPYPAAPSALLGGVIFAGKNGVSRRVFDTDWTNFAPRAGIAYRLAKSTVIRTGAGVFYRQQSNNLASQYGYSYQTQYTTSLDGGITPSAGSNTGGAYSLANPFPNGLTTPTGSAQGLTANVGNSISMGAYNVNYRTPRTYQYSFGIQQQIPGNINLEVSYAGNKEIFVPVAYNMDNNPANLTQLQAGIANPTFLSQTVTNPFYGILPTSSTLGAGPTIARRYLMDYYPLFTGVTQYVQVGHYRSDQLLVRAEKRLLGNETTGIFTFLLSYTFGKQMQEDHRTDSWNTAEPLDWEIDDGTKKHSIALSGVWELPFGKGRHFFHGNNPVVSRIASDWHLDWILTYYSGFPVGWPNLVNYCGVWQAQTQNEYSWFNNNKSCYATQPTNVLNPYQDRFSTIFNPAAPQLEVAVQKQVAINERFRLQLRGEAFNITNTPIRPGPDTTFSDSLFGQLPKTQNNFPRQLQVSAKFIF